MVLGYIGETHQQWIPKTMKTANFSLIPDQEKDQRNLLKAFVGTARHFFCKETTKDVWGTFFAGVSDPRNPNLITYSIKCLLFTGVFLFACQLGSRRGVKDKFRENGPSQAKFAAWFGVENSPHGDTLNYGYKRLKVDEVQELVCRSMETLIRKKVLYRYRLLGVYFLVAIDGTGVLTFHKRHCPQCLTKKLHNG
jgi:hypothetical protein